MYAHILDILLAGFSRRIYIQDVFHVRISGRPNTMVQTDKAEAIPRCEVSAERIPEEKPLQLEVVTQDVNAKSSDTRSRRSSIKWASKFYAKSIFGV